MVVFGVIVVALAFAMNIGASGTSAAMSSTYGAGAIRGKLTALVIVGTAFFVGSVLAGGEVAETLGGGLIKGNTLSIQLVLVVLIAATLPLVGANFIGIPLSTSAVTVGAIVGVGLVLGAINHSLLAIILATWVLLPILSFSLTTFFAKLIRRRFPKFEPRSAHWIHRKALSSLLIASGLLAAFAYGANNVANAIGPLINGGILSSFYGLLLGGIALGTGAVVFGHRVLETGAKRFTQLNIVTGSIVNIVSGILVLVAALLGIPVPLVQSTSAGILGIAYADQGPMALTKGVVRDMLTVWVVSPVLSLSLAYVLAHIVLGKRLMETQISYPLLLISAVIVGAALVSNRRRLVRRLSQAIVPLLRLISASMRLL